LAKIVFQNLRRLHQFSPNDHVSRKITLCSGRSHPPSS
jgi:hypothetical protein